MLPALLTGGGIFVLVSIINIIAITKGHEHLEQKGITAL